MYLNQTLADGNGRTERLLIMHPLIKHSLYPVVISVDQRLEYIPRIQNKDIKGLTKMLAQLHDTEKERANDFERMRIEEQK